jgi:hypothetical protein
VITVQERWTTSQVATAVTVLERFIREPATQAVRLMVICPGLRRFGA